MILSFTLPATLAAQTLDPVETRASESAVENRERVTASYAEPSSESSERSHNELAINGSLRRGRA